MSCVPKPVNCVNIIVKITQFVVLFEFFNINHGKILQKSTLACFTFNQTLNENTSWSIPTVKTTKKKSQAQYHVGRAESCAHYAEYDFSQFRNPDSEKVIHRKKKSELLIVNNGVT